MTAEQESPHSYSSIEVETDVNVTGRKLELHRLWESRVSAQRREC